jgi:chromate transporter
MATSIANTSERLHFLTIFRIFLRLGLTSFGGPIAHLGYFHREFVEKRKWLDEHAYADLVSLCQFLPGPASSQVGIALGLSRGGIAGALASWAGFTLPSAIALVLFAQWLHHSGHGTDINWLHGLKIVTVAVVAQALWAMGKNLSAEKLRVTISIGAAVTATLIPSFIGQAIAICVSGVAGWIFLRGQSTLPHSPVIASTSRVAGTLLLAGFAILLLVLPVVAAHSGNYAIALFANFYRTGALVFGGGHVVLPLLQAQVVPAGWVSNDLFLIGYGAAQAVPGPLFTFAAYLGAVSSQTPSGWIGAGIALVAIFLPSFLLIAGILPYWESWRRHAAMQRIMAGINAAVVGLLLAAFYNPVWTSAIRSTADFNLALVAFLLLVFWKLPPWLIVVLAVAATAPGFG